MEQGYYEGDVIDFGITVFDPTQPPNSSTYLVDPTTLVFLYSANGTATVTLTYTNASNPAPGTVWRLSLGLYKARVVTAVGMAGKWVIAWKSTGIGQLYKPDYGVLNPAPL